MTTRFVDVDDFANIVAEVGIVRFLEELVEYLREDFLRWHDFEMTARVATHSDVGVIELMPVSDKNLYSFKYVNGHPLNTETGRHTVMAFGALAEQETGYPIFLSELTLMTAFRTAATSVLAAKAIYGPTARSMSMIGCGAQSEFQAIAFHALMGVEVLRIYDIDYNAMAKLERNLRVFPHLHVVLCTDVMNTVEGTNIITTVTADKRHAEIIQLEHLEDGMHINAVGGDCPGKTELERLVMSYSNIFVEYEPQTRIEGELQLLSPTFPCTELWKVLKDGHVRDEEDITIFDSVGFALEDFSALRYLHKKSWDLNIGQDIKLVPPGDDPKDLFAHLNKGRKRLKKVA